MVHYLIELAMWILVAYFLGCLLGWALRNLFGSTEQAATPVVKTVAVAVPAAAVIAKVARPAAPVIHAPTPIAPIIPRPVVMPIPVPIPVVAARPVEPIATGKMERPRGIAAARGGKPDDLQRVSGIGPKNEAILHKLGFFHFDQIAQWTSTQVEWVDDHLRIGGRIKREDWIKQAALLAAGNEAEFTKLYGTGGLKNAKGETLSGSRTRK